MLNVQINYLIENQVVSSIVMVAILQNFTVNANVYILESNTDQNFQRWASKLSSVMYSLSS